MCWQVCKQFPHSGRNVIVSSCQIGVSFKNPPPHPAHAPTGWNTGLPYKPCSSKSVRTNGHVLADSYRQELNPGTEQTIHLRK